MHSLSQQLHVLKQLKKGTLKSRKSILLGADKNLVHCICECAHNTLQNNVPLTKTQYRNLAKHKKVLRRLTKKGENWSKKKKVIIQSGGFLLPLITPILTFVLSKLINE
jgi:hypothetical protein